MRSAGHGDECAGLRECRRAVFAVTARHRRAAGRVRIREGSRIGNGCHSKDRSVHRCARTRDENFVRGCNKAVWLDGGNRNRAAAPRISAGRLHRCVDCGLVT